MKDDITFADLDKIAYRYSDNEFAKIMEDERKKLFRKIMLPNLFVKNLSS